MSRSHLRGKSVLVGIAILLSVVWLAGCGAKSTEISQEAHLRQSGENDEPPGTGFGAYEDARIEYEQESAQLELPPGMVFPDWRELYSDEAGSYERGVGVMEAQMYWMNAWIVEWLEQRGKDPQREARALAVLRDEVPSTDLMTTYGDQSMRDYFATCLEQAELGDPSGYQQTIAVNQVTVKRAGEE